MPAASHDTLKQRHSVAVSIVGPGARSIATRSCSSSATYSPWASGALHDERRRDQVIGAQA